MKKKLHHIYNALYNAVITNKTIQRFLLLSPLGIYAIAVLCWVFLFAPASSSVSKHAYNHSEASLNTGFMMEQTSSTYDVSSSILLGTHDVSENPLMSQFFSGKGGFDSFRASNFDFHSTNYIAPSSWIQELQTEKEYPNLSYSTYRIKEGDMIGRIAEQFNVNEDTLISVNNIRQTRSIQIGEYLRIPSMAGILYTVKEDGETPSSIAKKYDVSPEKTASVNGFSVNVGLEEGNIVFVPDALLDWVTKQEINGDLFRIPIRNRYYISSHYGWRNSPFSGSRSFHAAIDMAAPRWTPIYGALVGTVSSVRYDDPVYGHYVVIRHHSGYTTLYAHMVDINVRRGQSVDTNSIIGWVGSTGMSTGDHLHFAVSKYGTSVNPATLWN